MTPTRHKPGGNPAAQQSPALIQVCYPSQQAKPPDGRKFITLARLLRLGARPRRGFERAEDVSGVRSRHAQYSEILRRRRGAVGKSLRGVRLDQSSGPKVLRRVREPPLPSRVAIRVSLGHAANVYP